MQGAAASLPDPGPAASLPDPGPAASLPDPGPAASLPDPGSRWWQYPGVGIVKYSQKGSWSNQLGSLVPRPFRVY